MNEWVTDAPGEAYCSVADSTDSDQVYLSGITDLDEEFVVVVTPETSGVLLPEVPSLDRYRSAAETVATVSEYDVAALLADHEYGEAFGRVIYRFLTDLGIDEITVPPAFPYQFGVVLSELGVEVTPEHGLVTARRRRKSPTERDHIRAAHEAAEAAVEAVATEIRGAETDGDRLVAEGRPLTAARLKRLAERTVARHDASMEYMQLTSGPASADPRETGRGEIHADGPILVDVCPAVEGYVADFARTLRPAASPPAVAELFQDVTAVLRQTLDRLEAGRTGRAVCEEICAAYEDRGYNTDHTATDGGFITFGGHGVGLDIHEEPFISADGGQIEPGAVLSVEPGLYDPSVGGVRIEEVVVIEQEGPRVLGELPWDLTYESPR